MGYGWDILRSSASRTQQGAAAMTTTDKTILALLILCAIGAGAYQYWEALAPLRTIAQILATTK
jgi:hypothetical protein